MRNNLFGNRIKKFKRGCLIWKTLFLLLFSLWLDNIIFTFLRNNNDIKNKIQIKRAKWLTALTGGPFHIRCAHHFSEILLLKKVISLPDV